MSDLQSDDLFIKMFMADGVRHPLFTMAWADWCTMGNVKDHMAFLKGHKPRNFDDAAPFWFRVQAELVWKYLYPPSKFLRDLVRELVAVLTECVETQLQVPKFKLFTETDLDLLRQENQELFEQGQKATYLETVRRACTGGFFKWDGSGTNEPPAEHFESFQAVLEYVVPTVCAQIGESDRYEPQKAAMLLGDPKGGWKREGLIGTLMRPIEDLVTGLAKANGNNFNDTTLGEGGLKLKNRALRFFPISQNGSERSHTGIL